MDDDRNAPWDQDWGNSNPDYTPLINQAADRHGVDPNLIRAVGDVESGWNTHAVSPQNAGGVMQIIPGTADSLGVRDRFQPGDNINGGTKLLRQNFDRYGTPYEAIAAYHGGTDTSQWGPRTYAYVNKVMDRWQHYKDQAGQAQPQSDAKPWEQNWGSSDAKPWEHNWGATGQQQSAQPSQGLPQRPPGQKPF
jgi:soluble lytic murein transglycosylase-like protein